MIENKMQTQKDGVIKAQVTEASAGHYLVEAFRDGEVVGHLYMADRDEADRIAMMIMTGEMKV